jgi:hypothetical protein
MATGIALLSLLLGRDVGGALTEPRPYMPKPCRSFDGFQRTFATVGS